jgi:alpha,alpha-trehalose phosphorylase
MEIGKYETLFTLGNGNFGLRGNLEETDSNYQRGTYINGFYETFPIKYGESAYGYAKKNQAIVNLVDGKSFRIYADGELFTTDKAKDHNRELDIKKGILTRTFYWLTGSGARIDVKIQRIVSLVKDSTAIQILEINVANKKVDIELVSILSDDFEGDAANKRNTTEDPRTGSASGKKILIRRDVTAEKTRAYMIHQTEGSGKSLFSGMDHSFLCNSTSVINNYISRTEAAVSFNFKNVEGAVQLVKYLCYHHGQREIEDELKADGLNDLDSSLLQGFEYYLSAQKSFLADFWDQTDVVIKGDSELQFGIRFNLFHLLQSTGRNGKVSIAAKGLTGLGYEGHYFWDTEIYVLPYFIYTFPEIAKSLLSYRYSIIDKARERAAELSHKGVLYPWRTINGEEASAYFPAGTAQYHINADIAFGINKYLKSTGDIDFLLESGMEILIETARFWYDIGEFIPGFDGAFCIHEVTGPDEYTALVNNNLYTNIMARDNLLKACAYLEDLKNTRNEFYKSFIKKFDISDPEISDWHMAAEKIRLPYDSNLSIYAQDDAFLTRPVWDFEGTSADKYPLLLHFHPLTIYRYQVIKQADIVMALFLQGNHFSLSDKKRNFDYYEELTTGDSSLSACIQGIVSSELGYLDLAKKYLRQTVLIDLQDLNGNVCDGVHTASMAGSWMSVIYGFAGMRDSAGSLCFSPRLPTGIDEISFKINYFYCLLSVVITHEKVVYELLKGDSLKLVNYFSEIHLVPGKRIIISLHPELRAVFIDYQVNYNIGNLVSEIEEAGIKCIVLAEKDGMVPPPDPELFLASAELLKERRWDCLGITTRPEGETAIKSAEMACMKVTNFKDLTLNGIRSIHEEYSLNWNRGINYP